MNKNDKRKEPTPEKPPFLFKNIFLLFLFFFLNSLFFSILKQHFSEHSISLFFRFYLIIQIINFYFLHTLLKLKLLYFSLILLFLKVQPKNFLFSILILSENLIFFLLQLFRKGRQLPKNIVVDPELSIVDECPAEGTIGLLALKFIKALLASSVVIYADKGRYSILSVVPDCTNVAIFSSSSSFRDDLHEYVAQIFLFKNYAQFQ